MPDPQEPNHKSTRPPAIGGQAAESGIAAQYRYATKIILHYLITGTLGSIRLRDPGAGQVDDFQILTTDGFLHAYQVKWETDPGLFKLNDLVTDRGTTPCLLRALADGWSNRRRQFPRFECRVHLVTPSLPSKHSACGGPPLPIAKRHFASFIRQAWIPVHRGIATPLGDGTGWEAVWSSLREASGLSAEDFPTFVQCCGLEFDANLSNPPQPSWRREDQWENDARELSERLISLSRDATRKVEFSREELLQLLGWPDDASTRNVHEWHPNESWHVPRQQTSEQLRTSVDSCESGYVALVGLPGSGKSTSLTEFLRGRPDTVRYYAFVRDESSWAVVRGEAVNFLHDLGAMLQRSTVKPEGSRLGSDLDLLSGRFYRHLQELHEHWKATGRKTVLLVDGLDHIPADRRVIKSLLDVLPPPEAIPAGVVFLLGTQTLEVLPSVIAAQFVREPERRVIISGLSADDIIAALSRAGLREVVGPAFLPKVVRCIGGSPLLLAYLIRRLLDREPTEEVSELITEFAESGGDVVEYYSRLWSRCERPGPAVVEALALLSRLRNGFEISDIGNWMSRGELRVFRQACGHLFKREGEYWRFFHNSFRQFIRKRSTTFEGEFDASEDVRLHRRLADLCAAAPVDSPLRWDELFHRAASGEDAAVLSLSHPKRFREQVLALRPVIDLSDDHLLVARSITRRRDPLAFFHLVLAAHERDLRINALQLEHDSFVKLLYKTAPRPIARHHLLRGGRLNLSHEGSLAFLRDLLSQGRRSEAAELFEVLGVSDGGAHGITFDIVRERIEALAAWVALAVEFWPVDRVIEAVKLHDFLAHERKNHSGLSIMREWTEGEAIAECLALAAGSCAIRGDIASSVAIEPFIEWHLLSQGQKSFWHLCRAQGWLSLGKKDDARICLNDLLGANFGRIEIQLRHLEVCVRCADFDEARRVFELVPAAKTQPARKSYDWNDGEAERVLQRYAACRVLGRPLDAPLPIGERTQFRLACLAPVSWFAAEAWAGKTPSRTEIHAQLRETFAALHKPAERPRTWDTTFDFAIACHEITSALVTACGVLGSEAVDELAAALTTEWSHPKVERQWSLWARQDLTMRCLEVGAHTRWAENLLAQWDVQARGPANAEGRAGIALCHAAAWRAAGNNDRVHEWVKHAVRVSFGFGYNDGWRLEKWVGLLCDGWQQRPEWGLKSIAHIARCLVGLKYEFRGGEGSQSTGARLLGVAFQISPRAGQALFEYFISQDFHTVEECIPEIVRCCSELKHAPFDHLKEMLAARLYVEENAADERHLLDWFHGAHAALGWQRAAALARGLPRPRHWRPRGFLAEPWWRGLAVAALQLGQSPGELGITEEAMAACRPVWAEGHRVTNAAVAVAVLEAIDLVGRMKELLATAHAGRERSHSAPLIGWDEVVELAMPRLSLEQLREVTVLLEDEHHFQLIASKVAPRLFALGDQQGTWELGERALSRLKARGRWDSASPAEHLAALYPMLLADPIRARPILFETAADHGLPEPHDLQNLLPLMLGPEERDTFAREAQSFLEAALDGCDIGSPPLDLPISTVDAETLRAALSNF